MSAVMLNILLLTKITKLSKKNTKTIFTESLLQNIMLGFIIVYSIAAALKSTLINRVIVSTDSEEYAELSRSYGAETPFIRPDFLAGSEVGKFDVWKHALESCEKYYNKLNDSKILINHGFLRVINMSG